MNRKKKSVRAARMELEFALVDGDQDEIKKAEQELAEALAEAEAAKKNRASEAKGEAYDGSRT